MKYYELFEKYKRSLYFFYDNDKNKIDGFDFYKSEKKEIATPLYYKVEKIDSYLDEYDYLPVSSGPPLVSKKFKETFSDLENNQLQFFPTVIKDEKKNISNNFYTMNILNLVEGLDKKLSVYDINKYGTYKIKKLKLIPNCLKDYEIVRLKEKPSYIIVTEIFKKRCEEAKLKGLDFVPEGL